MLNLTALAWSACLYWVLGMLVIRPQSPTNGFVSMIIGTDSILRAVEMLVGNGAASLLLECEAIPVFLFPAFFVLSFFHLWSVFKKHFKTCIFLSGLEGVQKIHSFIHSFIP